MCVFGNSSLLASKRFVNNGRFPFLASLLMRRVISFNQRGPHQERRPSAMWHRNVVLLSLLSFAEALRTPVMTRRDVLGSTLCAIVALPFEAAHAESSIEAIAARANAEAAEDRAEAAEAAAADAAGAGFDELVTSAGTIIAFLALLGGAGSYASQLASEDCTPWADECNVR
jgi:hypothetical protein